jgi:biopolymer transport protein TolR
VISWPASALKQGYGSHLLLHESSDEMKIGYDMLRKRHRSGKLFSDFNTLQFASVMGIVVFVVLLVFMTIPVYQSTNSVNLPHVAHLVSMPSALREDALIVSILRDGRFYFGSEQITDAAELSGKIQDRLKDHGVERKVYINADMRARWGGVKQALNAVRSAGILRVAFLVNQRSS